MSVIPNHNLYVLSWSRMRHNSAVSRDLLKRM